MPNPNFRVIIPTNADELIVLGGLIIKKHLADGANSPLITIDMADMGVKNTTANKRNVLAGKLNRDKEKATQERDLALGINEDQDSSTQETVDFYMKSCRDILLGIYKGREQRLGDWGYEVNQSAGDSSVFIPTNPRQMIDLAILILAKDANDGAASPLKTISITDFAAKNTTADKQDVLAAQLGKDTETAVQERNTALGLVKGQKVTVPGNIRFYATSARDILLGIYKGNEQRLGDWGYEVNFSEPGNEFPAITGSIGAGATKNVLSNQPFDDTMEFKIKNTGVTKLKCCLAAGAADACTVSGIELAPASEQTVKPSQLGDITNTHLNITNLDAATEGRFELRRTK